MKNKATILFLLAVLASPLAQGFDFHVPDAKSTRDWMNGTYESRIEIENQWEYERRVIDLENQVREQNSWQRKAADTIDEINDTDAYDGWGSL